jgi:hypothetical protein
MTTPQNPADFIPPAPTAPPAPVPTEQFFTAAQLEAARQQEKDKLYGKQERLSSDLETLKTELESLRTAEATRQTEVAAQQQALEDAKKAEEEAKMTAKQLVERRETEFKTEQENLRREMDLKIATMQKEQEYLRLSAYIQRRVAEEIAQDSIIPDLVEYINGDSEEAVELSITKAKEKTASIIAGASRLNGQTGPSTTSTPGFGPPSSGPIETITGGSRQPTPEQIAAMSMAEYQVFRAGLPAARTGNGKGLFD